MTSENEILETEETQDEGAFEFVTPPEFKLDYQGECLYKVAVSIAPENVVKQAEELFAELKDDVELPGFRRGKAPLKLLENKFGKSVRGEAASKLVAAAFQKLVEDEKLRPLDAPELEDQDALKEIPTDAPLEFTLSFEVTPRCELGQYRDLELERPILKVGDKQLNEALSQMQERFATFEAMKGNAKAKDGDQLLIDFKGTIDGIAFDGGSAENYPYILGSKRFLPDFEAALEGAKAGEELAAKVTFPEDYPGKDLAGNCAEFAIKVHEIKRKKSPDLDDDFAKTAGYESLEELKSKVMEHLQEGAKEQSDRVLEYRALNKVVENSTFEIPKSLIESSASVYLRQEIQRLSQMRVPPSQIDAAMEDIQKKSREIAENNIKALVALNEIGDAEGVKVTDEDFEKEAEAIGRRTGMDRSVVNRFLAQSEKRSEYEGNIFRQKSVAVILDNAKIKDKAVTQEELDKADDEASVETDE